MRTNKTISIDIDVLKEMLEYCNKYNVTFSRLIVVLWEFFKKKNNLKNTKSCSKNLIYRPSDSTIKKNIKFYESFALLQINQKCESIDSNYSTSSERLVV